MNNITETGFTPADCEAVASGLSSAYSDLISAIDTQMQSQFFGGMKEKWYTANAVKFFDAAAQDVRNRNMDVFTTFKSINDFLNSAANGWVQTTGNPCNPVSFANDYSSTIASQAVDSINGKAAITSDAGEYAKRVVGEISGTATNALTKAINVINSHPNAFLGEGQMQSFADSMERIKTNIQNSFERIDDVIAEAVRGNESAAVEFASSVAAAASGN